MSELPRIVEGLGSYSDRGHPSDKEGSLTMQNHRPAPLPDRALWFVAALVGRLGPADAAQVLGIDVETLITASRGAEVSREVIREIESHRHKYLARFR